MNGGCVLCYICLHSKLNKGSKTSEGRHESSCITQVKGGWADTTVHSR